MKKASAINPGTGLRSRSDAVNPDHYTKLRPEPIEVIEAWGLGYHEGNILKYLARWKRKNGKEDLKKAQWYLERLISTLPPS